MILSSSGKKNNFVNNAEGPKEAIEEAESENIENYNTSPLVTNKQMA
jgi:hypothetical protein